MKNTNNEIELRSEEVQDILTAMPNGFLRQGIFWAGFIFFVILILSFVIEFPAKVSGIAQLTTAIPPQRIIAQNNGRISHLLVSNDSQVNAGTHLALLANSAEYEQVLLLKEVLKLINIDEMKNPSFKFSFPIDSLNFSELGSIAVAYENFESAYIDYHLEYGLNPFIKRINTSKQLEKGIHRRISLLQEQVNLLNRELQLTSENEKRNKILLDKGVVSNVEFERTQIATVEIRKQLKISLEEITALENEVYNTNQFSSDAGFNNQISKLHKLNTLKRKFDQLTSAITDWESQFLFKSNTKGYVAYTKRWAVNDQVLKGQSIFYVLPLSNQRIIAEAFIEPQFSGNIKENQSVRLDITKYPAQKFGYAIGEVISISEVPDENGKYLLLADMGTELRTTLNKLIPYNPFQATNIDIIVERKSLAQSFLDKLRIKRIN
ncbi:MAG: hypothetical protein CL868_00285 [Cytophagaceae bacterium]|nr:hypothetical protein [Cytophagaceae bacterium]|tara:strand:+ start:7097 stop:8404 length:1308 start_codon:yes stop_codon:yes gene_type:complete